MVAIRIQSALSHRCDSHAAVHTSPYPPDRKFITRGKWNEAILELEIAANSGLVLSAEASHPCSPSSCLHPITTAMCVWNRIAAARHPHVCVHSIHMCVCVYTASTYRDRTATASISLLTGINMEELPLKRSST